MVGVCCRGAQLVEFSIPDLWRQRNGKRTHTNMLCDLGSDCRDCCPNEINTSVLQQHNYIFAM